MNLKDILTAVAAFITSIAGAGAIILGVSSWVGKVWADRLMQSEQQKHSLELEGLRSDLKKQQDAELERLRLSHSAEIDVLIRRREVYQRMATTMRIFLSSTKPASEEEKKEYLKAYDLCYLWASDDVVTTLGKFLDLIVAQGAHPRPEYQTQAKALYGQCMTEMRRDAGFPSTGATASTYRLVYF